MFLIVYQHPDEDGIHATLQVIEDWENKDPLCPATTWLKNLLELILCKNVFRFNDKFYIQKRHSHGYEDGTCLC